MLKIGQISTVPSSQTSTPEQVHNIELALLAVSIHAAVLRARFFTRLASIDAQITQILYERCVCVCAGDPFHSRLLRPCRFADSRTAWVVSTVPWGGHLGW